MGSVSQCCEHIINTDTNDLSDDEDDEKYFQMAKGADHKRVRNGDNIHVVIPQFGHLPSYEHGVPIFPTTASQDYRIKKKEEMSTSVNDAKQGSYPQVKKIK